MKLTRCNGCGKEEELVPMDRDVLMPRTLWYTLALSQTVYERRTTTDQQMFDLCAACHVALRKMLESPEVKISDKTRKHPPTPDCLLVFNPGNRQLFCRHEDPELFDALVQDQKRRADSTEVNEFITKGAARLKAAMNAQRDAEADPEDLRERKCTECGTWVKRYGMVVHMREAHPEGNDEPARSHPDDSGRIDDEPIHVKLCPGCKCLDHGDDLCKSAPNCLCRGPKEISELQEKLHDMTTRVRLAGEGYVEHKYNLDKVKPNRFESTNMEVCSGCSHMPHSRGGCVSESRHGGICECRVHLGVKLVPIQRNGGHERIGDV